MFFDEIAVVSIKMTNSYFSSSGGMLSDPVNVVPMASTFTAQVLTLDLSVPITMGVPVSSFSRLALLD